MIVKFFTNGTGGSKGVFDYLLKDKEQPDGKRLGAEVLRGDIDNQALLIDSLDFKQKYTSGCLSFTETADEVTQAKKNALMDGFEQTIRAGLDVDRVSVSWIEHRDKGRLELNFVFANVDLEHGRAFQPYVHSVDKRRVNAWKDMQNIEHGFTDPNDPANKRLMAQRDNLPRDIKDARQAITDGLKALVVEGVITNRDDVIQALTDGGFEIARETDKAISIKNPDPTAKRNIRLTGGLYERGFKFSREVQSEITAASEDYRAGSRERYDAAKQLYESEIERKRSYHQARHGKPRHEQRAVARDVSKTSNRYVYSPRNLYEQRPSPYHQAFKPVRRRHREDDRSLHTAHSATDRAARRQDSESHQVRDEKMGDSSWSERTRHADIRFNHRSTTVQQVLQADLYHSTIAATTADTAAPHQLRAEVSHGQETTRASTESPTSTAGHDQTPRADARRPTAIYAADARRERPRYSGIDSLIEQIGKDEDARVRTLANVIQAVEEYDDRSNKRIQRMGESSEQSRDNASIIGKRIISFRERTNSTRRAVEDVSEHDNTARLSRERYREVGERIERISGRTDQNRAVTSENNRIADSNRSRVEEIKDLAGQVREVIKAKEQELERARAPTRSRSPSMGR